jgi:hypothetical protein
MQDIHEPRAEFVERLERRIADDMRRRNRQLAEGRGGWPFDFRSSIVVAALMLLSIGLGAGVTAASYQAQDEARRTRLVADLERLADLARQRLATARVRLDAMERDVAIGVAAPVERLQRRVDVAEAQGQLAVIELQLEEVRVTAREPLDDLSAPLVGGRDFVSERLRSEMSVPVAVLEIERLRLRDAEQRKALGVAEGVDVDVAAAKVAELGAAVEGLRRKLEIRERFVAGRADAAETELRALEATALARQQSLTSRVMVARQQVDRMTEKVKIGTGTRVDLAEATYRLQGLEAEMAKAELDVEIVRRQLQQLKQKPAR